MQRHAHTAFGAPLDSRGTLITALKRNANALRRNCRRCAPKRGSCLSVRQIASAGQREQGMLLHIAPDPSGNDEKNRFRTGSEAKFTEAGRAWKKSKAWETPVWRNIARPWSHS